MKPFKRDSVDTPAQMLSKEVTDRVFGTIEALCAATSSPQGFMETIATEKKVVYKFKARMLADLVVVLNGTAYTTNLWTDGRLEEVT